MGRPEKSGLDFFPLNVDFFTDTKIEFVASRFDEKGELIVIKLLCRIYKEGYFIRWDDDMALLFSKGAGRNISPALANDVVNELLKRGFFNKGMYTRFSILTSAGIQKRYNTVCDKNSRKSKIIDDYNCINELNDGKEEFPDGKPELSAQESTHSKVKYSTEEKSKVLGSYDPTALPAVDMPNLEKECKEKYKLLIASINLSNKEGQNAAVTKIKCFILEHKPTFHEPYVQYWNLFAGKMKLPTVTSFSDGRKRKFNTRINEPGFNLVEILKEANGSDLLKESRWFTWNWIFENQENYVKVLEGNYRNKAKEAQPAGGTPPNLVNQQLEEIRKIREQNKN